MKAAVYFKKKVKICSLSVPCLEKDDSNSEINFFFDKLINFIFGIIVMMTKLFGFKSSDRNLVSRKEYVLCRVRCVGVNPVDAKYHYGDKVPSICRPLAHAAVERHICGIDFSGVVIQAKAGSEYSVGDEVFGVMPPFRGSYAEVIKVPIDSIYHKPQNISFSEASCIPLVGLTTVQAFRDLKLKQPHHILVIGASGGCGHVIVQVAKARGFRVTAVS